MPHAAAILAAFALSLPQTAQKPTVMPSAPTPSNAAPTLLQAQTLADAGKLEAARSATQSFLAVQPGSAAGHYLLGYILFRMQQPAPSLVEYTRAAALQPPTAQQLKFVAYDYVLANDYPDADKWMTRAVSWQPSDSELWYSLGRIKNTENRFAEGRDCLLHALSLSPKLAKAEDNLGLSYEGLNQPEQARKAYETAIELLKSDPPGTEQREQPLLNLGKLDLDTNQLAEALPLLQQAETIAPGNVDIHASLGRLYERQGNTTQAQQELEQAVQLAPNNSGYHFQLGQVYRKAGHTAQANAEFAAAQRLDGEHSSK